MSIGTRHAKTRRPARPLDPDRARGPVEPSRYFGCQHVRCRVAAAILLVPALPVMALLVLVIRLLSRGPAVYRQTRVGLNGRTFVMYKFRSMRVDAEAATGAVWTAENDPRVTRLGRVLRKLHLDEFPQLFNVVKGEMALIGPRPERPEFTHKLAQQLPGYLGRLAVRPGITGLAQINLPPDTDLESVRRKLVLDLEYVERASLSMDLRILAATFLRLFHVRTALLLAFLRLRREPDSVGSSLGGVPQVEASRPAEQVRRRQPTVDDPHFDAAPRRQPSVYAVESHFGCSPGHSDGGTELDGGTGSNGGTGSDFAIHPSTFIAQLSGGAAKNGHSNGNGHADGNGHSNGNGHADGNGHAAKGGKTRFFRRRPK